MQRPVKQVGTATGQLFKHLEECQPELCKQLRSRSKHSPLQVDEETGEEYTLFSFEELLPHHARFVQWCFRAWRHFYETRSDNGLLEFVRGYDRRANLPHQETCKKLLEVYEELMDEQIYKLISLHKQQFGLPCAGETSDIWSLKSNRESFGCELLPLFFIFMLRPVHHPRGPKTTARKVSLAALVPLWWGGAGTHSRTSPASHATFKAIAAPSCSMGTCWPR